MEETAAVASLGRLIDFATDAGLAGVELLIWILSISISSFAHKKRPTAVTDDERGLRVTDALSSGRQCLRLRA
ncbi:hypothetical protein AUR04nite_12470 [Glutamicibacter uratoxydans]|uniref:Uncharacterized protein n=1 Tax=Glutamicibacter uratoxydans TaxID=43667 RepID=A0A4Y4DQ45_GLUUR|nr:hypothetical protein AUR04nite_12470 [Glutamicibacter uratoxydans]